MGENSSHTIATLTAMALFIAQCPACHTSFRIQPRQLRVAAGLVRCGACLQVFPAAEHRVVLKGGNVPAAPTTAETQDVPGKETADFPEAFENSEPPLMSPETEGGANDSGMIPPHLIPELHDEDALGAVSSEELSGIGDEPIELEARPLPRRRRTALYLGLNLLLAAALLAQVVWTRFDSLIANPRYRPALESLCRYTGCDFPAFRDLAAIASEELSVRSHPSASDALLVNFIFRNKAALPQDFPHVELSFYDLGNRLLANRRFPPEEYLPVELRALEKMPPGVPVQVSLEIVDPGVEAVNYQLAFRLR